MQALDTMLSRRSVAVPNLMEPAPGDAEITRAVELALRAPDHGLLRPWRFVLIRGAARERLADLLVAAVKARDPNGPEQNLNKAQRMARNAPLIIAVAAHLQREHKTPVIEQQFATAAGVMNLLNAFHAQGYGAIWLTGANSYDARVARALGFGPAEQHLGFVCVGTPKPEQPVAPSRPDAAAHLREWLGPMD